MKTMRIGRNVSFLAAVGCLTFASGCSDDEEDADDGAEAGGASATGGSSGASGSAGKGGSSTGGSSTGGSSTGGSSTGGKGGSGEQSARIRVLHLSPDAPGVDVFVNGGEDAVVENLEFPSGTPYLDVPAGSYTFDVAATGTSADEAVLTIDELELEAGASYTAVAFDELASITALPLVDDYADLGAGDIRVRAVHAASAVGQVDIWNVPETGSPAPLWTNVDFGVAGSALDLPAGAYTIGVDVDDDMSPDLTFALPALPAGTVANVFAVNDANDDVFLIAQLADGTTARIDPE
jgi:hypothetical protein